MNYAKILPIVAVFMPAIVGAAYPVYQQPGGTQPIIYLQPNQVMYQQPQQQVIYQQPTQQQQIILPTTGAAVSPTRVTGNLPRVGSNISNAGRQYYEPQDYNRLADSGLYVGLSAGYSASVNGGMKADYAGMAGDFLSPGAFQEATFKHDTVIPLQVSVGAAINNDVRLDFSYTRYGSIGYADTASTADGAGGFIDAQVTGGAINANTVLLNAYYNIDGSTGSLMGGMLRPYVGAGVGISLNTISDYVIYDGTFYAELDPVDFPQYPDGTLTGVSDIYAYHNGGTTENLAYMLEGGVTADLNGGLKLDFFARYSGLGRVKPSGSIVVSQTEWLLADGSTVELPAEYDSVLHYTNRQENGNLSTIDVGVRLRLQF